MKRRLFNVLARVSLVLCVATAVLWVRSYWHPDAIPIRSTFSSTVFFGDRRGHVELTRQYITSTLPSGWSAITSEYGQVRTFKQAGRLTTVSSLDPHLIATVAFCFRRTVTIGLTIISSTQLVIRIEVWAVPFLLFVLVFATFPASLILRTLRASRRSMGGLCPSCGYDLRATPDRYPECGRVPEKVNG
jgi:hypothetical protein